MKEGGASPEAAEKPITEVARDTRRRIGFLLKKPVVDQQEFYRLFKRFFQEYLRKRYEFTMDELRHEVHCIYLTHAIRERIEVMLNKMSVLEYTNETYEQEEIKTLLKEFDSIVAALVTEQQQHLSFFQRFFARFSRQKKAEPADYPSKEDNDPVTVDINTHIEAIYAALDDGKNKVAIDKYKDLNKRYESLGTKAQEKYFQRIQETYAEIQKRA